MSNQANYLIVIKIFLIDFKDYQYVKYGFTVATSS